MLDSGQVYILASNADLSKHDIPDHGGKFVEKMSTSDIDLLGIVCVDISRMSAMPKPIWGPLGVSGGSWCELLAYSDKLSCEVTPRTIVLDCAGP